jgi:hypothetical protein
MAEAAKAKYAKDDIVFVPFPASYERKSDLSKGKILSVKAVKSRGVGFVYKVQLQEETGDALVDDVEFHEEGTEIWATECMISNVRGLRRDTERVKGVRVHNCVKFGCSDESERPKYDIVSSGMVCDHNQRGNRSSM